MRNPKIDALRVETLAPDRFNDLARLHQQVFRSGHSAEYLAAKYDTSWCGVGHVATIAYDRDRPVGFYGALPQRMRDRDRVFIAAHTCDSITAVDYRGMGLHGRLARAAYANMSEADIAFAYAYHSEATFRACRSLGWKVAMRLKVYRLPVATAPLASAASRNRHLLRLYLHLWQRVTRPFVVNPPDLVNSNRSAGVMHVDYGPDFFAYKHFTPNLVLGFGEARAWVRAGGSLWVGDLTAPDGAEYQRAIAGLTHIARRAGLHAIVFQVTPDTTLDQRLGTFYEPREGARVGFFELAPGEPVDRWGANFGDFDTF